MTTIRFTIPLTLPTRNVLDRMHWAERGRLRKLISAEVFAAVHPHRNYAADPFDLCNVTITRYSPKEPDKDGLVGSVKGLLDVLQPVSARHPNGLGLIADDSSACILNLDVRHAKGKDRTDVVIEQVEVRLTQPEMYAERGR